MIAWYVPWRSGRDFPVTYNVSHIKIPQLDMPNGYFHSFPDDTKEQLIIDMDSELKDSFLIFEAKLCQPFPYGLTILSGLSKPLKDFKDTTRQPYASGAWRKSPKEAWMMQMTCQQ